MKWKPIALVFPGGTEAARKLYGKRIKVVVPFHDIFTFEPTKPQNEGPRISIRVGTEGYVGKVPDDALDVIIVAFPLGGPMPQSIDALLRKPFHAIRVNWPTLRNNFHLAD